MIGAGYHRLEAEQIRELIEAYPREGIESSFLDLILREVRMRPAVVTGTWMADVGRQILGDIRCPTWNEMVAASPFDR